MAEIATDLMAVTKDLAGQLDILKDNIEEFSETLQSILPKILVRVEDLPDT